MMRRRLSFAQHFLQSVRRSAGGDENVITSSGIIVTFIPNTPSVVVPSEDPQNSWFVGAEKLHVFTLFFQGRGVFPLFFFNGLWRA